MARTLARLLLSVAVCAVPALAASAEPSQRPLSVVLVLVDDQGYYDLGCYGATEARTPRIDALAGEGMRFTSYYAASPICSPSRAGLLTGCYPRRVGMETWVQRADSTRGIHPDETTLGELFRAAGHATACIGKWHLGHAEPFLPRNQGFDRHFGLYSNLDPVETQFYGEEGVPLMRDGEVVKRPAEPAELTRRYTDEAIAFLREVGDQPFFLYLPHTTLRVPLGVSPEFVGRSEWGEYGDAIEELDHHVGRLLDALAELGRERDTVVVYTSDNGRGPGRNPAQPMQGRKLTTWEAGIRVPAILRGPGVPAGSVCDEIVSAMDWYPTLASFAGIALGEDHPPIDGRDLLPLFTGRVEGVPSPDAALSPNAAVPLRRRWEPGGEWAGLFDREDYLNAFFYHGSEGALAAVRSGRHKLVLAPQPTLYDLEADPGETKPLGNSGEVVRRLRGLAVTFQEEMSRDARPADEAQPPGAER